MESLEWTHWNWEVIFCCYLKEAVFSLQTSRRRPFLFLHTVSPHTLHAIAASSMLCFHVFAYNRSCPFTCMSGLYPDSSITSSASKSENSSMSTFSSSSKFCISSKGVSLSVRVESSSNTSSSCSCGL